MTDLNILQKEEWIKKTIRVCRTQEDIFGEKGLLQSLIQRALQAA